MIIHTLLLLLLVTLGCYLTGVLIYAACLLAWKWFIELTDKRFFG
jgi:hypothetical protein